MRFFRQRITPVENITFIAMMAAFNALISLVAALLPLSAFFIMVLAPLTSAAVALFCKKRYLAIFLIASMGICIAVTAWDFMTTLFYMIPALITGAVYGFLWRLRLPTLLNLFLCALVSMGFFYLSILLIKGLLGADMIEVLFTLIRRGGDEVARNIFPLFVFVYSLAQVGIMHAFLASELHRLGQPQIKDTAFAIFYPIAGILLLAIALVLSFFHAKTAYFILGMGIYWSLASLMLFFPKRHVFSFLFLGLVLFGSVLLFAGVYRSMPDQSGLCLLSAPFIGLCLSCLLNKALTRKSEENSSPSAGREL